MVQLQYLPVGVQGAVKLDEVRAEFAAIEFPFADEQSHPDRNAVLAARSTIQSAVVDNEFLADCIALELKLISATGFPRGLTPFLTIPDLGIRFAFGYWPPGGTPGPHEHIAWTITAVCRNELEVQTFDRAESYRRRELVPKNHFSAVAGRVGYIYEPSIHAPINTSADWSVSLHVSSPRGGEPIEDCAELAGLSTPRRRRLPPSTDPYSRVVATRARTQRVHVLARALAGMNVAAVPRLLDECAALGSHSTRKLAARTRGGTTALDERGAYVLRRTHPDLMLSRRIVGDTVALMTETTAGPVEDLAMNVVAADAIAYAAKEPLFDARDLPGRITDEERILIAEALEDSGLFTREA
ncbi:hypothetical protein ACFYUD_35725 [Nocardia tengchongensis]|uniref:hypothetical protein n=1 Tax=Nocardia tengchongensis TaxID=2055889 RepID=UPI0036A3066C